MNCEIEFINGPVTVREGKGDEPYHMHKNANELIWVVEGKAGITFNNVEYIVGNEEDLMLIVDNDEHKIRKITDKLKYFSFYIDLNYFEKYIADVLNVGFYLNPGYRNPAQIPHLHKIRTLLADILWNLKDKDSTNDVVELARILIITIRNHFNYLGTTSIDYMDENNFNRMFGVYDFIYKHYRERVGLAELSEHLHLSQAYLSRSIKKIAGMGFTDILNYVRCEEALRLMLESDKSLTTIVHECGFSDLKYFNQYFMKFFYENPVEFRKKNKPGIVPYKLNDWQTEVEYNKELKNFLNNYIDIAERYKDNIVEISFEGSGDYMPYRKTGRLKVLFPDAKLVFKDRFTKNIQILNQDFPDLEIDVGESGLISNRIDEEVRSLSFHQLLSRDVLPAVSDENSLGGLFDGDGARTQLYYLKKMMINAEGTAKSGPNWIGFFSDGKGSGCKQMTLVSWSRSNEHAEDFKLTFAQKEGRYLFQNYTFTSDNAEIASKLSKTLNQAVKGKTDLIEDLYKPVCTSEIRNAIDGEHRFRVERRTVSIMVVIELQTIF